jgi:hypothetical protein
VPPLASAKCALLNQCQLGKVHWAKNPKNQVPMPLLSTARHPLRSEDAWLEAALWIINVTAVFFITHYLFEMNGRSLFFGWDGQSTLAFLGERHRFSSTLFGVDSDPVIGLGNISYSLNPIWFPSLLLVLSTTASGEIGAPLAFAIGATELFAATVLCGRLNGFAVGSSIAAGWLLTLMTWQLFGMPAIVTIWFFSPCHGEVLAISTIMVSAALNLGEGPVPRSMPPSGEQCGTIDSDPAHRVQPLPEDSGRRGRNAPPVPR